MQGMVTGMRGLCNGLGPAMFGVIFYLFNVDLNDEHMKINHGIDSLPGIRNETIVSGLEQYTQLAPGPPFVFGAFMVAIAILVAVFIPDEQTDPTRRPSGEKKKRNLSVPIFYFSLFLFILFYCDEMMIHCCHFLVCFHLAFTSFALLALCLCCLFVICATYRPL